MSSWKSRRPGRSPHLEEALEDIRESKVRPEGLLVEVVTGLTEAFRPETNVPPQELVGAALSRFGKGMTVKSGCPRTETNEDP